MNFHYIAEQVRNDWNNPRISPWYFKLLIYIAVVLSVTSVLVETL